MNDFQLTLAKIVHDPIYIYIQTKSVATMIKELEVFRL